MSLLRFFHVEHRLTARMLDLRRTRSCLMLGLHWVVLILGFCVLLVQTRFVMEIVCVMLFVLLRKVRCLSGYPAVDYSVLDTKRYLN